MEDGSYIGKHMLADLYGIAPELLRQRDFIMGFLEDVFRGAGYTILDKSSHQFEDHGQGVRGFFLMSDSQASLHTYPEQRYLALDIFTSREGSPESIVRRIAQGLSAGPVISSIHMRGAAAEGNDT